MLSIKKTKKNLPDLTEFLDVEGRKWKQTSTDDLFSTGELNDILDKIEKDKSDKGIILARFDFQKVNKEYYDAILELQKRLNKQNDILKKVLIDAKTDIDRKNTKLKELVKYIRKLHLILAYYKTKPDEIDKLISSPNVLFYEPVSEIKAVEKEAAEKFTEDIKPIIIEYTDAEEILLNDEGNEEGSAAK